MIGKRDKFWGGKVSWGNATNWAVLLLSLDTSRAIIAYTTSRLFLLLTILEYRVHHVLVMAHARRVLRAEVYQVSLCASRHTSKSTVRTNYKPLRKLSAMFWQQQEWMLLTQMDSALILKVSWMAKKPDKWALSHQRRQVGEDKNHWTLPTILFVNSQHLHVTRY